LDSNQPRKNAGTPFSDQWVTSQWIRTWVLEDCYPNFNFELFLFT